MIQRIQTLYLLIVAVLLFLMFFFPVVTIDVFSNGSSEALEMRPFGLKSVTAEASQKVVSTPYMGILLLITFIISFFNIFLYRHRWVQIRFCFVMMVLELGLQLYVAYYLFKAGDVVKELNMTMADSAAPIGYSLVDIFPIICIILTYLAFKGIIRDEMLVRSLDRIR